MEIGSQLKKTYLKKIYRRNLTYIVLVIIGIAAFTLWFGGDITGLASLDAKIDECTTALKIKDINLSEKTHILNICMESLNEYVKKYAGYASEIEALFQRNFVCGSNLNETLEKLGDCEITIKKVESELDLTKNLLNECDSDLSACSPEVTKCVSLRNKAYQIALKLQDQGICSGIESSGSYEKITECFTKILEDEKYVKVIENLQKISEKIDNILPLIS